MARNKSTQPDAPATAHVVAPKPAPERIGKYPITRELGRGATSRVYLARDTFANRDVAIKVMHKDAGADAPTRHRFDRVFLNEASLAGKLNHPNIIGIFDADVQDEFSYLVMEYVRGQTLEPYCEIDNLLSLDRVVEIVFKCGQALDFASRVGIIHRDIKPANILVDDGGEIKVTDFGVALQRDADVTQLEGVGSPLYMSPEQAQDLMLTHQTDIYSLGVVMYRLLTGKTPFFASNSTSLLYQIVNMAPPAPRVHRPDLPADLDRIVMKAIAKKLEDRYPTWEDFSADLARINKSLVLPEASISETEKFGAIKAVPFFSEFAHLDVWEMVRIAAFRRIGPQEPVVREGDSCESFYLIAEGEARVMSAGRTLSVLGDGDCFGEIPYFEDRGKRTSSVVSVTPLTIIEVNAGALRQSSDACQKQFNRAFVRILLDRVERLSIANAKLTEAAHRRKT
ncbi:MAG TPA: protein kinase [Burkholderiales bacterium]|nr:protein kinase [Burkholderiales bacterium]